MFRVFYYLLKIFYLLATSLLGGRLHFLFFQMYQRLHLFNLQSIPLRRLKRSIFQVQGPCARATNPVNTNGGKGHLDMCKGHNHRCKGLCCVQGPHLWPIYLITNDKQYNLVQGPQLEVQGPLMCARASSLANLPNY